MKKGARYFGMAIMLACLLVLCTTPAFCARIDKQLQTLSAGVEAASEQAGDAERIEMLTALIVMYSEQLEEYDRSNGTFVVACVGFAGTVLGFAINLFISKKEEGKAKRPDYGMAALFTLIPGTMALCLYVFSMQCRRVVFFRGYLTYLEGELSKLTGIPMVFNSQVVGEFFGKFNTMNAGFWVMGITVGAMLLLSIGFCVYFALPNGASSKRRPRNRVKAFFSKHFSTFIAIFFILILVVFSCSSVICVVDLCSNGGISNEVYEFCLGFSGGN